MNDKNQSVTVGNQNNIGVVATGDHTKIHIGEQHIHPPATAPSIPEPLPNANPAVERFFIGREQALAELQAAVAQSQMVVVTAVEGMAGVGKSFLVDYFAKRFGFADRYFIVPLNPLASESAEMLLSRLAHQLQVKVPELRARLLALDALVHVENVDSVAAATVAGALNGQLQGCKLVLTGRLRDLGLLAGGQPIVLTPFEMTEAVQQLTRELALLKAEPLTAEEMQQVLMELAGLPLAIHLAAGYLRTATVETFLAQLKASKLRLTPKNPLEAGYARSAERVILASTFEISWQALLQQNAAVQAVAALGFAPAEGVGESLAVALLDLDAVTGLEVLQQASEYGLLEPLVFGRGLSGRWRVHPLLAQFLREQCVAEVVQRRLHEWLLQRLPKPENDPDTPPDYTPWHALQAEMAALMQHLAQAPVEQVLALQQAGSWFADMIGPWASWQQCSERVLASELTPEQRLTPLWVLCVCARKQGELAQAEQAARDLVSAAQSQDEAKWQALAWGKIADILQARGQLDEALDIRQQEQLPVYERLGDVREKAVTMGKIADILQARGQLDEALDIRQQKQLPIFERLGDVREKAVMMGRIADILQARGQLDEALDIRQQEELPVYERLGDVRELLVARTNLAIGLLRKTPPDTAEAQRLFQLALDAAEQMRIPEAGIIRKWMQHFGF